MRLLAILLLLTTAQAPRTRFELAPGSPMAVEIQCQEWSPKPKGCKIADGKTLDDLTAAFVRALAKKDQETDFVLRKLEQCDAKGKP